MPNISVQLRRGTDTEHSSFTGAVGEVTVDTTNDTLRVHDGSTAGGVRLAKLSEAGGSGTVTSVDSGTGLTGGPITTSGTLSIADNGVTFAKMQDINTAKVIGRTTAGSGDPEEVSILDEDAMTSDSATALATQQSIKAYVDAQVGSSVSKFVTGNATTPWVNTDGTTTVGNSQKLTFTHGLGNSDLVYSIHLASDSSGTNAATMAQDATYGAEIVDETTTQFSIQLGSSGFTNAYIKVVAIG